MDISWITRHFDELTTRELYALLQLRSEVFVVEQHCVFQDMDNRDMQCYHVMGWTEGRLVAYTRLVPPGVAYPEASIGRVVTSPLVRGSGAGRLLMEKSIAELGRLFGKTPVRIGAQLYLVEFYRSFGFETSGDVYDEDGIQHIEMLRT